MNEERGAQTCEFFEWLGASCCDRCGRPAKEHKGMRCLRRGAGPFGGEDDWEDLAWDEWDARVDLDRRERAARGKLAALPAETVVTFVERAPGRASTGDETE